MRGEPGSGAEPVPSRIPDEHVIQALEPAGDRLGGAWLEVSGGGRFRVPEDVRRRWTLQLGDHLTAGQLEAVIAEAGEREALDRAVFYLSHRPRTCREVRRYLSKHGLSRHVDGTIARCRELGYLDDERYARSFVRERLRLKPRGAARLVSELLARGISRAVADEAVQAVMREDGYTESALLRDVAEARVSKLRHLDPPVARRRLTAFLARRGFRGEEVRAIVLRLLPDRGRG